MASQIAVLENEDLLVANPELAARSSPKMRKMQHEIESAEKCFMLLQHFFRLQLQFFF